MPARATNEPNNYSALGKQAAKGTEAVTFTFLRHLDGTGFEVDFTQERVHEGGDGQEIGLAYKTGVSGDGAQISNFRGEVAARQIEAVLGSASLVAPINLATVASGVAAEAWIVPGPTLPYYTVDQFFGDQVERAVDSKYTSLDFEFEAGRPFKVTANHIAGGTVYFPASPLSPTREVGPPIYYPGASVVIEGLANTKVTKGKITVTRGVDDGIRTNGLNREDVVEQTMEVHGELTMKYENATLYDKVKAGGALGSQVPVDLATGAMSIWAAGGAGVNFRSLGVFLNQFHYSQARVNKLDPDGKTMYLDVAVDGYKGPTHQIHARVLVASAAAL